MAVRRPSHSLTEGPGSTRECGELQLHFSDWMRCQSSREHVSKTPSSSFGCPIRRHSFIRSNKPLTSTILNSRHIQVNSRILVHHSLPPISSHSTIMAPKRSTANPSSSTSTPSKTPSTSTIPSSTSSSSSTTLSSKSSPQEIAVHVYRSYLRNTPSRTKLLDVFMAWLVVVGGVQFAYCVVGGNYVSPPGTTLPSYPISLSPLPQKRHALPATD